MLQLYLAFGRSTTPIPGKGCAGRRKFRKKLQFYLAFARSTTPIHGKGCASRLKVATLPRVPSLDHANPWEGLRVTRKSCNFTSRSVARPRESLGRVARHAEKLQLYLAFGRSTTPIPGKGCASRRKVGKSCNFTSRSRVRPRRSMGRVARQPKSCNFTSRSVARPHQSLGRVARHAEKLRLYVAFGRSTTPIPGKGCASRRKVGKSCNFTSRSRDRPRQSMRRVAFPIDGVGAGSGFRKNDLNTEM